MKICYVLNSKRDIRDLNLSGLTFEFSNDDLIFATQNPEIIGGHKSFFDKEMILLPQFYSISQRIVDFFSLCRLWRYKERSASHFVRAVSIYGSMRKSVHTQIPAHAGIKERASRFFSFLVRCFSFSPLFFLVRMLFHIVARIESCKFSNISRYQIMIVPYMGELSGRFDLIIEICKIRGVKTVSFQANWDNLSSKNFIYAEPDFFGVWGEQSLYHLRTIQRLSKTVVKIVGSPRSVHKYKIGKPHVGATKRVIFAGDGVASQDFNIIDSLCRFLDGSVELIYKPHPYARNPVDLDQLRNSFGSRLTIYIETTPREYVDFLKILGSADLLVSQLSTMCLDALLLDVPVCMPLFTRQDYLFGYKEAFQQLTHFAGLQLIPELVPVYSEKEFSSTLRQLLNESFYFRSNLHWVCAKTNFAKTFTGMLDLSNLSD